MFANLFSRSDSRYSSRSLTWRFGIGGIAVVLALAYSHFFGASSYIRAFESIKTGMNVSQVVKAMGNADRSTPKSNGQRELYWKYVYRAKRRRNSKTYHFYVYVDSVGVVQRKFMKTESGRY